MFARDGYSNASIAEVASNVGLTLPGLLHCFPRKTDMLLAVLEVRDQRSPRLPDYPQDYTLEDAATGPPLPWSQVVDQLRLVNRANAEIPGVIRAFSLLSAESLGEDHPAQGWFHQRSGLMLQHIAHSLRHGQESGEIKPTIDPDQIAAELIAMMDGLQLPWLRPPTRSSSSGTSRTTFTDWGKHWHRVDATAANPKRAIPNTHAMTRQELSRQEQSDVTNCWLHLQSGKKKRAGCKENRRERLHTPPSSRESMNTDEAAHEEGERCLSTAWERASSASIPAASELKSP